MTSRNWQQYYQQTRDGEVFSLLPRALLYSVPNQRALDLGAGALRNTRYLLEYGFEVTAVDSAPEFLDEAQNIDTPSFRAVQSTYTSFDYPANRYGLVVAAWALPFTDSRTLDDVVSRTLASLAPGGVFCGNFYGPEDGWSHIEDMTFVDEMKLRELFAQLEILSFEEIKRQGKTAAGTQKQWHYYNLIARKSV